MSELVGNYEQAKPPPRGEMTIKVQMHIKQKFCCIINVFNLQISQPESDFLNYVFIHNCFLADFDDAADQ